MSKSKVRHVEGKKATIGENADVKIRYRRNKNRFSTALSLALQAEKLSKSLHAERAMLKVVTCKDLFSNSFDVNVLFDDEAKVWVAQCDSLSLVTESKTFEELISNVKLLAAELIELNDISVDSNKFTLNYKITESVVL
jgi:hypothetical protein